LTCRLSRSMRLHAYRIKNSLIPEGYARSRGLIAGMMFLGALFIAISLLLFFSESESGNSKILGMGAINTVQDDMGWAHMLALMPVSHPDSFSSPSSVSAIVHPLAEWGKDEAFSVAFAPNSESIAVGSSVGIYGLETESLAQLYLLELGVRVNGLAFSPDGTVLAAALFDDTIQIRNASDGQLLRTLQGHTNWVRDVAFSPEGSVLASASDDDTLRLWRISDGALLRIIQEGAQGVRCVAFSPDGALLASGLENGDIGIWRVADGELLLNLKGHTEWVRTVAFSPDGTLLASGSFDKTARIWRVSDGALLHTLEGHTESVLSVMFSPDGSTLATGSVDKTIGLWQVDDGTSLTRWLAHDGFVYAIAFSPFGDLLASGGQDNTVRLWKVSDQIGIQEQPESSGAYQQEPYTTGDCRYCHHPKSSTQSAWVLQAQCEVCHPEGASLNWCPAFPRSSQPVGLSSGVAKIPPRAGVPGDLQDIGIEITVPGNGEIFYSPKDTFSPAYVNGVIFTDGKDPSQFTVHMTLYSDSNELARLTTTPLSDGTFSFPLGLNPEGGLPFSSTNIANSAIPCLSCHAIAPDAFLPPGLVRLLVQVKDSEGSQAQDQRWVLVEQSGQASVPVQVLDADTGEPVQGISVEAVTRLYGWRGRNFNGVTDSQGEIDLEVEALAEASTSYLVQTSPSLVDGVLYTPDDSVTVLLPAGASSASPVTLKVRSQDGQIQGDVTIDGMGPGISLPIWAVRISNGKGYPLQVAPNGHYDFSDLPIADYVLTLDPKALADHGWNEVRKEVDLTTMPSMEVDLSLTKVEGLTLQGSVRSSETGSLPFAWVEAEGESTSIQIDPETSEWQVTGLSAGVHSLIFTAPGFYSQQYQLNDLQEIGQPLKVTLSQRPDMQSVPWGSGEVFLPPETSAAVQDGKIHLQSGWVWGQGDGLITLVIDASDVEIVVENGAFALEEPVGERTWLYLTQGEATISSAMNEAPVRLSAGQMIALAGDRPLSAVPFEAVSFLALHPPTEAPLSAVWRPTLGQKIQSWFTNAWKVSAQTIAMIAYAVAILIFIFVPIAGLILWHKRRKIDASDSKHDAHEPSDE
jgi:WD40 repeat protein